MDSFPWTFMNSRILLQLGSLDPWIQPWILSSPNALTGLQLTQEGPLCRSLDFSLCSTLSSAAGCLGFPGLSSWSPPLREAAGCLGSHPLHCGLEMALTLVTHLICFLSLGITVLCCLIPSVLRRVLFVCFAFFAGFRWESKILSLLLPFGWK